MRRVYKYPLVLRSSGNTDVISIPKGGIVRHVDMQNNRICLWVEVDFDNEATSRISDLRTFGVFGTGHEIPEGWFYYGTVLDGAFVWHVYEQKKGKNA